MYEIPLYRRTKASGYPYYRSSNPMYIRLHTEIDFIPTKEMAFKFDHINYGGCPDVIKYDVENKKFIIKFSGLNLYTFKYREAVDLFKKMDEAKWTYRVEEAQEFLKQAKEKDEHKEPEKSL